MLPHNTETPLGDSNHQISNSDHQPSDHEAPLSPCESENNNARKTGKWTSEEDDLLRKYVPIFGERQWRKISEHIPGRSSIQCLHRWTKILKPGLIKGPWTAEEDQKLVSWVKTEGATKWAQCSNYIKGRSGKQCRERWFNNLNPDVKKGNWSKEEDELIFQLYQKYGSSWSKIAKVIPGRTENAIKNRFYSTLRRVAADKKKMKVEHEEEMSGKEGETEKLELPMGNMTGSSNLLYALLNEKTQEKEEKGEEGHEGKEKGKETTEKQAFNVNGEKVVIARDVKRVNERNIQEAATRLMNNEIEDNDAAFEEFLGTLSGGLEEDFLSREFESGRKADDVGHLEDLQKKVLTFCQNNIKDLAETFKMIEANKASTTVSESGISEGKVNLGKITGKQEGNTQKEMIRNKVLTPTPVNQKEVIRIQQWNGNPGIGHGGFSLYNSKGSPKGGSEKSSEKAEDSKENKIEVEIKEKDKGNQEIEKRMVFLFQQLYSLERLLAKTRSDLIQFESDLKGGKDLGQENVKMEESEFDKVVKKKKV